MDKQKHSLCKAASRKGHKECKHGAPWTKQCTSRTKVVCPGVAKKHFLKVSGRKNALGSFLVKRSFDSEWFAPTSPGLAVVFRSNTNTQWTWRVPVIEETHFQDVCAMNCLERKRRSTKALLTTISRATRQMVGYFCGYTTKRQVVGKYELDHSSACMNFLSEQITTDNTRRQLSRVTNRMLSDLQCRGIWKQPGGSPIFFLQFVYL